MSRVAKNRPTRTPLGARNRLTFKGLDTKNFFHRVITDKDDRLDRALEAGYEFVEAEGKLGDVRVAEGTVPGAKVAKPVGNGETGYLMRIPREFYNEDQAAKAAEVNKIEKSMNPDPVKNQYGSGITDE
jgi:hypothetical protein